MKHICIILFACLLVTACQSSSATNTPDNNATIAVGVVQTLTAQANQAAIAQTVIAMGGGLPSQVPPSPQFTQPPVIPETPTPSIIAPTPTVAVSTSGDPKIVFTYVPAKGSNEYLSGRVEGVNPEEYEIAIYIHVGGGWWTKPTFASPVIPISSDGTWSTPYATGGNDTSATAIVAYLVLTGYNPPVRQGEANLPSELEGNIVAKAEAMRE